MPIRRSPPPHPIALHASLSLLAAAALAACNSGSGVSQPLAATLERLQIAPSADAGVSVPLGTTVQFHAVGTYSDGSTADLTSAVTWSSADEGVAVIDPDGLATPVAVGRTVVRALEPGSGIESSAALSVVPAPLEDLEIAPLDPTILVGMTLQLRAWGTFADESYAEITENVNWTTSDAGVASVSSAGLAAAVAVGTAAISATDPVSALSASTSAAVTDVPAALSYVVLSPGSVRGGSDASGTVVLTSYTDAPVTVSLWTSDPRVTVPAEVVVPAGADRATFTVTTTAVEEKRVRAFVWASDGTSEKRASLNVRAPKRS